MARDNKTASNAAAGPGSPQGTEPPGGAGRDVEPASGPVTGGPPPGPAAPEAATEPGTAVPPRPPSQGPGSSEHVLERTRVGGTWVAVGCFAVVLLLLLVFILENGHDVSLGYFGAHASLPLGVALVLAAVSGALLVMFAGMARITQMRTRARRHRRAERKRRRTPGD